VVADYFSPFTLHQRLLSSWFPQIKEAEEESRAGEPEITALSTERDRVSAVQRAGSTPGAGKRRTFAGLSSRHSPSSLPGTRSPVISPRTSRFDAYRLR
jgi:hypothetical protein